MTLLLSNSFAHLFFREGCGKARMQIYLQNGNEGGSGSDCYKKYVLVRSFSGCWTPLQCVVVEYMQLLVCVSDIHSCSNKWPFSVFTYCS